MAKKKAKKKVKANKMFRIKQIRVICYTHEIRAKTEDDAIKIAKEWNAETIVDVCYPDEDQFIVLRKIR